MVLSEQDFLSPSSSKGSQSDWCGFTEHSVNYQILGRYADSTSQMSVAIRVLSVRGSYCNWKFTISAMRGKGGHPYNAHICWICSACNSLAPHLSKLISATGVLCGYSEQPPAHHRVQWLTPGRTSVSGAPSESQAYRCLHVPSTASSYLASLPFCGKVVIALNQITSVVSWRNACLSFPSNDHTKWLGAIPHVNFSLVKE